MATGEIRGRDWEAEIVLQPGRLLAIALAGVAVTLPALRGSPNFRAASEDLLRGRRRPPDVQGRPRRLLFKKGVRPRRIGAVYRQLILDVLDNRETIRKRELIPGWHRGATHAAGDRAQQIAVGWERLLGQPELEDGRSEATRPLPIKEGRSGTVAVAAHPVAADAPPPVNFLAVGDPFFRTR